MRQVFYVQSELEGGDWKDELEDGTISNRLCGVEFMSSRVKKPENFSEC